MKADYGKTGTYFYLVGLTLIGVFLPTSKFGLSVTQFYLIFVWMLVGIDVKGINTMFSEQRSVARFLSSVKYVLNQIWNNIQTRFKAFMHNKVAVIVASMYLMHILGLLYTSDFQYAFKDLRIKLPLLLFPILLSSMKPLSRKHFDIVIWCFISSVFFVTVLGAIKYFRRDFIDVRELSVFVSHIRVCLCIVLSIFILAYFVVRRNYKLYIKIFMLALILWFLWQVTIFESFISVLIIAALSFVFILYFLTKISSKPIKITAFVLVLSAAAFMVYYPYNIMCKYMTPVEISQDQLDTHTRLGNPYVFDTVNFNIEDGRYVGYYLAVDEMLDAWSKRSSRVISNEYDDDLYTLIRYLTSKDLRKDADGVAQLTDEDVKNIENNIANYHYIANPGIRTRLMKVMEAYQNYKKISADGSSVFQRIEYIKASLCIIKEHPVFGVGVGDIANSFAEYYEKNDTKLSYANRLRCHNQYLAITVAFGVIGLIWFLFSLIYPFISDKKYRNYYYFIFLFILMLSMLTEDTIETQIGATLFAFFNSFLLFASPYSQQHDDDNLLSEGE